MADRQSSGSEVARLLGQIRCEYEAAQQALYGVSAGTSHHAFITSKMERMGHLHTELQSLIGDAAIGLVIEQLDMATK